MIIFLRFKSTTVQRKEKKRKERKKCRKSGLKWSLPSQIQRMGRLPCSGFTIAAAIIIIVVHIIIVVNGVTLIEFLIGIDSAIVTEGSRMDGISFGLDGKIHGRVLLGFFGRSAHSARPRRRVLMTAGAQHRFDVEFLRFRRHFRPTGRWRSRREGQRADAREQESRRRQIGREETRRKVRMIVQAAQVAQVT